MHRKLEVTCIWFMNPVRWPCFLRFGRFHHSARRALERRSPNMDVLVSTATCASGLRARRHFSHVTTPPAPDLRQGFLKIVGGPGYLFDEGVAQ